MASMIQRLSCLRPFRTATTTCLCRRLLCTPGPTTTTAPGIEADAPKSPTPSSPAECKIRQLHPREVSVLSGSQLVEGARLRAADLRRIYDADPGGFFLATTGDGDAVGTIAAIRQTERSGFIGFHHVNPAFQEGGAGLWAAAMDYLGNRNVGIEVDATDVDKYKELGFKEEWRNGCFKGSGIPLLPEVQSNKLLRPISEVGYGRVVDFDTEVCGQPRVKFLLDWLKTDNPVNAQVVFEGSRVVGYGVIRPLQRATSHFIGPLLAENAAAAQVLLLSLLSTVPKQTLFMHSPLANPSFTRLLELDLRMEQVAERVRMYTAGNPGVDTRKTFGVLSQDIG